MKCGRVDATASRRHESPLIIATIFAVLVCLPFASDAADDPIIDGFAAREYRSATGVKLPYRLYVPPVADAKSELPLIVYLHGSGGAGTDNRQQILGGNTKGTRFWTASPTQERHPAYVLAPQIPEASAWHSTTNEPAPHVKALIELLDELRSEFAMDARRIYVVGQSLGGYGAWDLIARYPDLFAAAVPLCGGGDSLRVLAARNVSVWAFHGARDQTVPVAHSRELVAALRRVSSSVRYTEYPDVGHDVWTRAFADPDLADWLFAQRKSCCVR
jgi:predicted peptidase